MTPYPEWVTSPRKMTDEMKRKKILVFLVRRAALQVDGSASYRALARELGLHHVTFCAYIARGRFSKNVAMAIEKRVGREFAPHELLMNPMADLDQ